MIIIFIWTVFASSSAAGIYAMAVGIIQVCNAEYFAALSIFGAGAVAFGTAILAFLASIKSSKGIINIIKVISEGIVNCFN